MDFRPLQTSLASCASLTGPQMRESASDFHWFTSDYGMQHAPSSILSSIYDSDDMMVSKEFEDEELAEIDMESFCREDMHNLLLSKGRRGSSCALVTSSIYRPERLFSPVPDQIHLSQDSLDMSGYEEEIFKTCKANKKNYTIAFEGSIICSEASFYAGLGQDVVDGVGQRKRELLEDLERRKAALKMSTSVDCNLTTWSKMRKTNNSSNLNRFLSTAKPTLIRKVNYQCWEEKRSMGSSGNLSAAALANHHPMESMHPQWLLSSLRRTKSLSSLSYLKEQQQQQLVEPNAAGQVNLPKLNVSQVIMDNMDQVSSASPSYDQNKLRSLLPNCAIPIHHSQHQSLVVSQQQLQLRGKSGLEENSTSTTATTTTSNNNVGGGGGGVVVGVDKQPSFNLVKLFIKQKSNSTDTCMDVSSGCWPSDSPSMSFEQQQNQNPQPVNAINVNIQNRNYFKRRLEGSLLDRHEEENDVDSLDPLVNNNKTDQQQNHTVMENNNNLINNLINNNHCATSSEEHSITQIYNNIRNNNGGARGGGGGGGEAAAQLMMIPKNTNLRRMQESSTVTRSMQTSIPKLITSATQYASKAADAVVVAARGGGGGTGAEGGVVNQLSQRVKVVPTSFLKQLHTNERRGDGGIAPVYVIYPNYTLPNLDFVSKHDVILSPIDYKEPFLGMGAIAKRTKEVAESNINNSPGGGGRPKSFSDILGSKQRLKFDYKNICDWKSLIVLLPMEYSRILRSIPDIEKELEGVPEDYDDGFGEGDEANHQHHQPMTNSQRQLFCQTTPVMRRRVSRPMSCDCTAYMMQTSSSSSSSNQPASSGYRGSSTILTDSELGCVVDNEEFSEASGLPPTHCGRAPKGILRRNLSRTSRMKVQQVKRNSMFIEGAGDRVADKRRSLQEFPTQQYFDNIQLAEQQQLQQTTLSPLLNFKQQTEGNDLSGLNRFRNKLSSELEALEMELCEAAARANGSIKTGREEVGKEDDDDDDDPVTITGSTTAKTIPYDRLKLRNDVSRALCNHPKRVSFSESNSGGESGSVGGEGIADETNVGGVGGVVAGKLTVPMGGIDFTTPPNSPNVSLMGRNKVTSSSKRAQQSEQERIQSNRFKRLQIQWELMSKDSESLAEEFNAAIPVKFETKSGGSTPTGPQRISRIPRPISYPAVSTRLAETSKLIRTPSKTVTAITARKVMSPTTGGGAGRVGQNNNKSGQRNFKAPANGVTTTTNKIVPKAR